MHDLSRQGIVFLQWLCANGGRRAMAGNIDFTQYHHLVNAGYLEVKPNRFSANILYFTITSGGRQTLETAEHGSQHS